VKGRDSDELLELADTIISTTTMGGASALRKAPLWYEQISKQIEREDGLINQRLTWMMQIQAFLFAGLAVLAKIEGGNIALQTAVGSAVLAIGLSSAVFGGRGVRAALASLESLRRRYLEMPVAERRCLVRPFGARRVHQNKKDLALRLPAVLITVWIAAAVIFLAIALGLPKWKRGTTTDRGGQFIPVAPLGAGRRGGGGDGDRGRGEGGPSPPSTPRTPTKP
jgi:hypothetical protein